MKKTRTKNKDPGNRGNRAKRLFITLVVILSILGTLGLIATLVAGNRTPKGNMPEHITQTDSKPIISSSYINFESYEYGKISLPILNVIYGVDHSLGYIFNDCDGDKALYLIGPSYRFSPVNMSDERNVTVFECNLDLEFSEDYEEDVLRFFTDDNKTFFSLNLRYYGSRHAVRFAESNGANPSEWYDKIYPGTKLRVELYDDGLAVLKLDGVTVGEYQTDHSSNDGDNVSYILWEHNGKNIALIDNVVVHRTYIER